MKTLIPQKPETRDQEATLRAWMIEDRTQHRHWWHFVVGCVHLRDLPGMRPAVKHYRDASYEVLVVALDSAHKPDMSRPETIVYLAPINLVYQFHGVTDARAIEICDALAEDAESHRLILEVCGITGARQMWRDRIIELGAKCPVDHC